MVTSPLKDLPIGVFDSGVGGLTVLKDLLKKLPNESFYYLGDTARVPYGTRSKETVIKYARSCVKFLLSKDVKILVIACHTASSYAIPVLKSEIELPIIGVVEPGARSAVRKTKNNRIGIIGTEGTIRSGSYQTHIKILNPDVEVFSRSCPLFVPLVEEGWVEGQVPYLIAQEYLHSLILNKIDVLLLGCTHYPLLIPTISKLTTSIEIVDSSKETAEEVYNVLKSKNLIRENIDTINQSVRYYVTDNPEKFVEVGQRILGSPIENVEWIDL
ncbi:MAG: glutamate racemase [Candidatus Hydrogenedentes bacterium]|nr:glutamate racemase [Candidatus Hydrogenedentota bacterium]